MKDDQGDDHRHAHEETAVVERNDGGRCGHGRGSGLAATRTDRPGAIRTGWDARKLMSLLTSVMVWSPAGTPKRLCVATPSKRPLT